MNRTTLTVTGLTIIGGLVAYAAYFDYKRRNDVAFRKKIRSQKKKVEQHAAEVKEKQAAQAGAALDIPREILLAIYEKSKEEPVPTNPEERHQFFVGVVATAERLAADGPHNYLEAAVYFYQALRVYPSPMELIVIYQKTVPEPVLMIVMELYNIDVSMSSQLGGSGMKFSMNLDEDEMSPISKGPPSEASSQEWDKVLGRIHGYYDSFPPKSMNVSLKPQDPKESKGGQTRTHSLVAGKSFKAGEVIYKETPIVAVLDVDVQARGTHCSQCLRLVDKDMDMFVAPDSDRLKSVYCSKECQNRSNVQSQDLLFNEKNPLPTEFAIDIPLSTKEARPKAQDAFANYWRSSGSSGLLLVARFVSMQIIAELAKALPQAAGMKAQLPEMCIGGEYSVYDHIERLRFVDVSLPDDEHKTLKDLLLATLPFLEDAHSDERHAVFRGKMAYNAIGVCLAEGRDDESTLTETSDRTRTPCGTAKQIGSGLYFVSSYLGHSCSPSARPSFSSGTSELHLVATRDITEGEELTMAYVDVEQHADETPMQARVRRRAELSRGWKFSCTCAKCEGEKTTLNMEGSDETEIPSADGSKVEGRQDVP
ncbi:MAS20-domain-containing protein [Phellopilus nigrolimitatus]|nr:MAS20-domain-containing protein [Phellopilus nigrolimitatus]